MDGIVAAGHPVSAEAGAAVLREGGNAVDAAIAACLASWTAEPLLTGPGAGGYLLVAGGGWEPALLDFFVAAPSAGERAPLTPVDVSFGDATQVFHVGGASVGAPGTPSGLEEASRRWGSLPLENLARPAAALARAGVALNDAQAYIFDILEGILLSTPEATAEFTRDGRALRAGETFRSEALAATIERFGAEGAAPFVDGDLADAMVACVSDRRRDADARGLARLPPDPREPAARALSRPPGVDQPAAVGRRDVVGLGPRAPGRGRPADAARARRGDGPRPAHARFDRADERFLSVPAAQLGSTTHVERDRRRRPRLRGDVHQRRGLGPGRARHRHPPQQHHGRGGPQPAGLLHRAARAGGCRR